MQTARRSTVLGFTALVLALLFIFTVTGRFLYVFAGPSLTFLRESWELADDSMVQESRPAVVQVFIDSGSRGQKRGTGFNICPEGLIVTNRHLVEGASVIRVSFPGHGAYTGQTWRYAEYADLAVIAIEGFNLPAVSFTSLQPAAGDDVLVIGNPLQFVRVANMGELIGFSGNPAGDRLPFLVIEAAIYPGSSGSPLFNEQGEVVGVVFATTRTGDPSERRGLAVSAGEALHFLDDLQKSGFPD